MTKGDAMVTLPVPARGRRCLTVACIDLGVARGLAAFVEEYQPTRVGGFGYQANRTTPRAYDHGATRGCLASDLAGALSRGPVALGLEAPLWGVSNGQLCGYHPRPLEARGHNCGHGANHPPRETTYPWYGNAGGTAALKAAVMLLHLLDEIIRTQQITSITFDRLAVPWGPGSLLIWEAFVTGETRGRLDQGNVAKDDLGAHVITAANCVGAPAPGWGNTNENMSDAFRAVRYGFANGPLPCTRCPAPVGTIEPVAQAAIRAAGVAGIPIPGVGDRCIVIEPLPGSGCLH